MKIYMVIDYNECTNTIFFSSKKNALKHYNDNKEESYIEFETLDVKPNKKGIIRAMHEATWAVGSNSVETKMNNALFTNPSMVIAGYHPW